MTTTPSLPAPQASPPSPAGGPTTGTAVGARKLWVLGGIGVVAVAAAVTTVVVVSSSDEPSTPEDTVVAYVDALRSGDYGTAYGLTCAEQRGAYDGAADYARQSDQQLGGALTGSPTVRDVERGDGGWEVSITLRSVFGESDESLDVIEEGGDLRVCDSSVNRAPSDEDNGTDDW